MINIYDRDKWLELLVNKLKRTFDKRLLLVAHVGSWAREDAEKTSDIDVNVILNVVQEDDILAFRRIVSEMPDSELACGFLGGKNEMIAWPKYDLVAFYYGSKVLYGEIENVIPAVTEKDIYDNTMVMLSNINHALRHSIIYDKDLDKSCIEAKGLYKTAFYVLQGWYLLSYKEYVGKRKQMLLKDITGEDTLILNRYIYWDGFDDIRKKDPLETLFLLERWSSEMFERMKNISE